MSRGGAAGRGDLFAPLHAYRKQSARARRQSFLAAKHRPSTPRRRWFNLLLYNFLPPKTRQEQPGLYRFATLIFEVRRRHSVVPLLPVEILRLAKLNLVLPTILVIPLRLMPEKERKANDNQTPGQGQCEAAAGTQLCPHLNSSTPTTAIPLISHSSNNSQFASTSRTRSNVRLGKWTRSTFASAGVRRNSVTPDTSTDS